MPTEEGCQAAWRDVERMVRSYSENVAASKNDADKMRKNAAKFDSVKGPQIIPIPSLLHAVPPGLHIDLLIGPALITVAGSWCDVLDDQVDKVILDRVVDFQEAGEEVCGEEDEENDMELSTAATTESTSGQKGHSEAREKLENEVQEANLKVIEADLLVQQVNMDLLGRMNILQRVVVNLEADIFHQEGREEEAKEKWTKLELLAKGENINKRFLKTFRFCSKLCLMTGHDHGIKEELCSACSHTCHSECELWDALEAAAPPAAVPADEVAEEMEVDGGGEERGSIMEEHEEVGEGGDGGRQVELRTCRDCRARSFLSFQEMREVVLPWVEEGKAKLITAQVVLERARAEEQAKTEELKYVVGPRRKELIRILEEELQVVKTAYQGGTYVGNHVSKILKNHEKISVVLASKPELQDLFNLFCSTYLRIHHTMKAARWLTELEVGIISAAL